MDLCDKLTDAAKKIGNVNTIVRREDDTLLGDNTDYYGFSHLFNVGHMNVTDRKVVVFGTGGAAKTVHAVLTDRGASEIVMVSRTGENNYENIAQHYDARFIVNTTPVGMFPNCPILPSTSSRSARTGELREGRSDGLFGVIDVVYNPARTGLMLQSRKARRSSYKRPAHARRSGEGGKRAVAAQQISNEIVDEIVEKITFEEGNIAIIGMPSGGKSTIGSLLAKQLGREFVDIDDYIPEAAGKSIADILRKMAKRRFASSRRRLRAMCASAAVCYRVRWRGRYQGAQLRLAASERHCLAAEAAARTARVRRTAHVHHKGHPCSCARPWPEI